MKPLYHLYSSFRRDLSLSKVWCFSLTAIVLVSLLASCSADEIKIDKKTKIVSEELLQRNDSIVNSPTLPDTIHNTPNLVIDPPLIPPKPPKPPKP